MPILVIHGSFENFAADAPLTQKVQLSTSPIPVQELELTGYHIQFSDDTTFHPDHIIVELPFLAAQVHVAGPASSVTKKFDHTYGLPLACSGYAAGNPNSITNFGVNLKFMVGKDIPRNFDINLKYYDPRTQANGGSDSIIQMHRPAHVPAAAEGDPLICKVNHILLYFNYKFIGNF
jgi:hypothetical protein